ncbi:MAG: hypothetical protein K6B46_01660 [Opitutales bacterium]|nr:hypothetical protein [Opitutales bacterium]
MKKNLAPTIAAFALPLIIIIGASFLLISRSSNNENLPAFPAEKYSKNPLALRGNTYSLNAAVEKQLAQNANGRVLSVVVLSKDEALLPVFVPAGKASNIEVGQRMAMTVSVDETSTITVQSIQKF